MFQEYKINDLINANRLLKLNVFLFCTIFDQRMKQTRHGNEISSRLKPRQISSRLARQNFENIYEARRFWYAKNLNKNLEYLILERIFESLNHLCFHCKL